MDESIVPTFNIGINNFRKEREGTKTPEGDHIREIKQHNNDVLDNLRAIEIIYKQIKEVDEKIEEGKRKLVEIVKTVVKNAVNACKQFKLNLAVNTETKSKGMAKVKEGKVKRGRKSKKTIKKNI